MPCTGVWQRAAASWNRSTATRRANTSARAWVFLARTAAKTSGVGFVAGLLTRNGVITLAAISPCRTVRREVRASIGDYVEVCVNAPLDVCEARGPKGLCRKARAGQLPGFTGIGDPYEPPLRPEVECRTDRGSLEESVGKVLAAVGRALSG